MEEELNFNQENEVVEELDASVSIDNSDDRTTFQQLEGQESIDIEQSETPVPIMGDYNESIPPGRDYVPEEEIEGGELGTCDCRSECKYTTGATWKYADYGYSD